MNFHAHSAPGDEPWEPLFTPFGSGADECRGRDCEACRTLCRYHGHLNKVAWLGGAFASAMFSSKKDQESAREWGWLSGLWHDLGKFAPEWQEYLRSKSDPHSGEKGGQPSRREDHSSAGAVFTRDLPPFGPLFSYVIAGHHAGLPDANYLFSERLPKAINPWRACAEAAGVPLSKEIPPPPLTRPDAGSDGMAFMLRFFFSCLVDADFLATEAFMQPDRAMLREPWPEDILQRMLSALEAHMQEKFGPAGGDPVMQARESVRVDCIGKADAPSGFFSLTVPTGGGKTLSSLLFALKHALRNGHRRVILVIPFTSIIKQNADVFREVFAPLSRELGREIVLEHHSKFDPGKETGANRLSAENWDSPVIVTTNVRFFESLLANRTSACRRLHRTARSTIIFDEAQALPAGLLNPIIRGLRCLVHDLGSTAVLCTATQPALDRREGFDIGIPPAEVTEIVRDVPGLFSKLERVRCRNLGPLDDEALISHILENAPDGCLVIVNTTKAAQTLHDKLSRHATALHLSARMCPAHVISVLDEAKRLRKAGQRVVMVATQLVEAGVDISFPVVYRAECGLDSFAQAAGRCNRNGELLPAKGMVFFFQPTDHPIPRGLTDLISNAGITRNHILPDLHDRDLLDPALIRQYFEHAIWQAGPRTARWDKARIVSGDGCCFPTKAPDVRNILTYRFKAAAERFRLIDSETHSILIPWGRDGKALAEEIRKLSRLGIPPNRSHHLRAQQFAVQVYDDEWQHLKPSLSRHCEEAFAILDHPEDGYHPETGLKRPGAGGDPDAYCL